MTIPLIVLLHGHDSSPEALSPVAADVREGGYEVLVPTGWCALGSGGRAWWEEGTEAPDPVEAVRRLGEHLARYLVDEVADGSGVNGFVLAGFSQGAALAVAAGLGVDAPFPPMGVASVAGFLADDVRLADGPGALLVVHGDDDEVVDPFHAGLLTRQARRAGITVEEVRVGGGHEWSTATTKTLLAWLAALAAGPH